MHGICHVDIPTTDVEKSTQFYSQVFDWEINLISDMEYTMFEPPEGPGGGFVEVEDIPEPGVVIYIEIEDIEGTLDRIAQHGGDILKDKTPIGEEMGSYAEFADPCGVHLGVWQAAPASEQ